MRSKLIFILGMALILSGCGGGGGGGSSNSAPTVDATGSWSGAWLSKTGQGGSLSVSFTQTGSNLSGTINLGNSSCFSAGNISGTVSGNNITTAGVFSGSLRIDLDGTIVNSQASGSYDVVNGGACTGDSGTWTLTRQ